MRYAAPADSGFFRGGGGDPGMSGREWLRLARRFLVLIALMFWQGGFTFYAAVVVPIGQDVVGNGNATFHHAPGRGMAQCFRGRGPGGAGAGHDRHGDTAPWTHRFRWLMWFGMAIALGVLVWLYPHIDQYLDLERGRSGRANYCGRGTAPICGCQRFNGVLG